MKTFGFAGFGAACAGFTVLSVLLGVALRGGNAPARRLLFATVFTALWALILAFEHTDRHPPTCTEDVDCAPCSPSVIEKASSSSPEA